MGQIRSDVGIRSNTIGLMVPIHTDQVKGSVHSHQPSLNESLNGEVQAFLTDEDQLHTYDDLTKVNPVTPTTVLQCLQARYRVKVFYTHAGCTLVALNPFQPIPDLYTLDVMKEYHCAPQPQEFKPHIFIVAEEAYRNVKGQLEPVNQSLVVSGESGAGKTWTSRCLMKYYATVAASSVTKSQDTVERIERRVLDSNPIMEAFGNACTLRNNNSSRFGKYIQLQLDRGQLLVGASVQTYLLEKTRVSCQPDNERNFHIFYQMMKGATSEQRREWKMPHGQRFVWLPNSQRKLEEDCFHETVKAMVHLGINAERQRQIFRILAGILQLGNLNFSSSMDESQPCDLEEQTKDFLQKAAELLQVPAEELQTCLIVRMLKAGKQSVLKPCSQAECSMRRDCLAKVIYAQLFEWLVTLINNSICADESTWCNFIGVLDVYGFECFYITNNLEQLCINYANEKLQQHFVAHYLRAQQEEYVMEGLKWSFVKYQDNQSCLDLIEGSPIGVFSLLNEESRLNRTSDAKTLRFRLEKELHVNSNISWDKFSKEPHFTVAHYAGKVNYQIQGMVEKNKDPVPAELIKLLQKSEDPLLHQIFSDKENESPNSKGLSKVTVVSKFKNSLESLMKILHTTTPHYTRCIKPNPDCKPLTFKKEEVIMQLEACGIVETIHISAAGFPIRILYKNFLQRYGLIGKRSDVKPRSRRVDVEAGGNVFLRQEVEKLLHSVLQHDEVDSPHKRENETHNSWVHCGRTKVFLTQLMLDLLEDQRKKILSRCAFSIQCCWLRYLRRKRRARQQSAILIQAAVRSWLVRKQVKRWSRAAAVIQRAWRKRRAQLKSLADAELDNAEDFVEEEEKVLNPVVMEPGSVQLSKSTKPVTVRGWPLGLALASAPSVTVSLTARGFQKIMYVMACLNLNSRRGEYKVETNQYTQELASIRAQPRGSIKLHYKRSPLLYADRQPDIKSCVTGFNEILLDKTL
ncbi:LOW QUALITY PROTEIN: unconventional myosin-XIX [Tautogolabrus adspersus]